MTDESKGLKRYVWDVSPSGSEWLFQCGAYPLPEHRTVLIPLRDIKEVLRKQIRKLEAGAAECTVPKEEEHEPPICPIFMSEEEREKHSEYWDDPEIYTCISCCVESEIKGIKEIYLEITGEALTSKGNKARE